MSRIEAISDSQWERIYALREEFRAIGTCTEPADRAVAERGIARMYEREGLERPRFVWVGGPASAILAHNVLANQDQLGAQLGAQLWDQLEGQLRHQFWDQLGDPLRDRLWELKGQLWDQFEAQLWDQLQGQLGDQLGGQNLVIPGCMRGSEETHWMAWLLGGEIAGVRYEAALRARLEEAIELHSACGWWIPYRGLCICAERHERVQFDAEHRLHCETGPAILCRDGYAVYAWHGTRVPGEWIESPDTLDPKTALTWENVEQRRCAAEIIGWDRVLENLHPRTIDADADPQVGTLLEVTLPDAGVDDYGDPTDGPARFLRVRCGTGRTFVLPVPPDVETALQAQLWTYGLDDPADVLEREART